MYMYPHPVVIFGLVWVFFVTTETKKQFNCDIRPVVGEGSLSESPTLENVSGLDSDESGNGTVCLPYILIKKK